MTPNVKRIASRAVRGAGLVLLVVVIGLAALVYWRPIPGEAPLAPLFLSTLTPGGTDGPGTYPPMMIEWKDLNEAEWGPMGRVSEYRPHDACSMCFTMPNYDAYQIFEYAKSDRPDGAIIIPREIPNPAPEVMAREGYDPERGGYYDEEDEEWTWYIGTQGFVGPTDREKWSDDLPVSTIEMKRVQARYMDHVMRIAGVQSFGIGTHGFLVGVRPGYESNLSLIPEDLEGLPVRVEFVGPVVAH